MQGFPIDLPLTPYPNLSKRTIRKNGRIEIPHEFFFEVFKTSHKLDMKKYSIWYTGTSSRLPTRFKVREKERWNTLSSIPIDSYILTVLEIATVQNEMAYLLDDFCSAFPDCCKFELFTQCSLRPFDNFVLLFTVLFVAVDIFFFLSTSLADALLLTWVFSFLLFFSWKRADHHMSSTSGEEGEGVAEWGCNKPFRKKL